MALENLIELFTAVFNAHIIYRYRFLELFLLGVILLLFTFRFKSPTIFFKLRPSMRIENRRRLLIIFISLIVPTIVVYILMQIVQDSPFLSMIVLSIGVPFIVVFGIKGMSEFIGKDTYKTTIPVYRHIERKRLFLMLFWIVLLAFLIRFYFMTIRYYPRTGLWDTPVYFNRLAQKFIYWEQGGLPQDPFYVFYAFIVTNGLDLIIMPRVVVPLIYSLSIIPFYFLTSEITNDEKTGILGSFLFAMCAESIRLIGDLYRNVFGIYFLIWCLFFTIKCINSPKKIMYGFLTFFYLVLMSLTHQVCLLVYFIVMITYSFAALFIHKKKDIGVHWLVYMTPYFAATIIYLFYFPGFLQWILKTPRLDAAFTLAQLWNNWFFSVTTNALALIGVYFSIKKRNLQYIFVPSFLLSIYVIWLMSGSLFGFWYFLVRIPERFYLFAFIPASALGGIALSHLIFTKKLAANWQYSLLFLILCLSVSGYDVISVIYFDYFYPPPISAREFEDAYWLKDNSASETPVITNLGSTKIFWLDYYILDSREVIQVRSVQDYESYSSTVEDYYLLISYSRSFRGGRSKLFTIEGLNRIYFDGQVTIYAHL